jgi:hypothetical protein
LVANEEEIEPEESKKEGKTGERKTDDRSERTIEYKRLKEKLIGKEFRVESDLEESFRHFLSMMKNHHVQTFPEKNKEGIERCYKESEYNNLRHLKQALWKYERLWRVLPEKARQNEDFLGEAYFRTAKGST